MRHSRPPRQRAALARALIAGKLWHLDINDGYRLKRPSLEAASTAWIYAGGSHHTSFSQSLTVEHLRDFAEMAEVEFLSIGNQTRLQEFRNELKWNGIYYSLTAR